MPISQLALMFFLVTNPIGNSPAILALIKDFDVRHQQRILFREGLSALAIAVFFQYFGEYFLGFLKVEPYSLTLCGGILLSLTAINMIFSLGKPVESKIMKQEPVIVPIATPLLSGPGLLTIIMLNSAAEHDNFKITSALLIAWVGIMFILFIAPYLQTLLGKRGLGALEQIMGMVLGLIGMEMLLTGISAFLKTL